MCLHAKEIVIPIIGDQVHTLLRKIHRSRWKFDSTAKTFAEKRNQWFEGAAKEFHLNKCVELIVLWTDASASASMVKAIFLWLRSKRYFLLKFDQTTKQSLTPDKGGV